MSEPGNDARLSDGLAAASIAFEAGQLLLTLRPASIETGTTASGNTADVDADQLIFGRLRTAFRDDAILSEEAPDSRDRLDAARVWIVDPLDGTREYNEAGRDDWAVHVALYSEGVLSAGAVALPAEAMLFSTITPFPRKPAGARPRIAVSRSRAPEAAIAAAERLGATLVPMGSAGAKAMAVVRGDVDAYVHAGGQWEWDSAAPIAVARASGLYTCRLDGSEFNWNQESPWQPDLVICRPELAPALLGALAEAA